MKSYTMRDGICGRGLGDLYFGGDWRTELWGGLRKEERRPLFLGVYAKMAEVGNGAVR